MTRQLGPRSTSTGLIAVQTQVLDFIHSHVRHFKLQARIFLACPPSCSAQPPLGKAGGTIMKRRLIML